METKIKIGIFFAIVLITGLAIWNTQKIPERYKNPSYCERENDCNFGGIYGKGCECINKYSTPQLKDCQITDKICYCDIIVKTCKTKGGFA